ncbi:CLUMA_CG007878, isoform A [Clunio marinus]|nr:CLUMA_CG007878, isoform A [Clunio marinus]
MDFKQKSPPRNGKSYYEQQQKYHHRSPYNELSTNQSLLHHINTSASNNKHHMDVYEYENHQKQQNIYVKNHYHSPKARHIRRRARSECLSPTRSPKSIHQNHQQSQQYHERFYSKTSHQNGYVTKEPELWQIHRRDEILATGYRRDYQPHGDETYKQRFHNLQIDGKSVQFEDFDSELDQTDYTSWHQRRRFRARSESASNDYFYPENYHNVNENRAKRTRDAVISPVKEPRAVPSQQRHVTNSKNNFSVLVNNNTTHYRYSPKSKVRSHYLGHKIGVVRVSSPLHKARAQIWKSQSSGSTTNSSIPSIESNSTPETPQVDEYDDDDDDEVVDDDDDDNDDPIMYGPGNEVIDDDMTDPEDNYENCSLDQRNLLTQPLSTINTNCVQGGHVLSAPFAPSLFPFVPPYISFATFEQKGPEVPAIIHKQLKWKLTTITPLLVRKVLLNTGFRLMKKPNDWVGTWGKHMKSPCFKTLHSYQKFNHLPGSFQIGRKDRCWRNLQTLMSKHGKKEFGFMPRTFIIPQDLNLLRQTWHKYSQKNTKWIIKPPASARGTGIRVVNSWSQIPKRKPLIVQRYIERPLLINGSKFDLRLYVLVTSMNPLRCYLHTDGLARFASVKYSERNDTLNDRYMHLTNYSINKMSNSYDKNDDANACKGMKWTIKSLWSFLNGRGVNTERLWGAMRNLVLRTIIAGEGPINGMMKTNLQNKYNCFELFGIDVLLDSELIPWLLEVNISPSLHSASGLDMAVKGPLVTALLNTALYQIPPKIPIAQQSDLARELNLNTPLCYDKRIYVTTLSKEERQKHQQFTQKTILREDYLNVILENLTPDDVRCLIVSEDELSRCQPLERIFPAPNSHKYLNFTDQTRYYNSLLDAWEHRYSKKRDVGIALLRTLCWKRIHLKVPPTTIQKDCESKDLEKIVETAGSDEPTSQSSLGSLEIEINANENRDTSNFTSEAMLMSPKKSPSDISDEKCFSNIMNCLPITAESEVILVKQ